MEHRRNGGNPAKQDGYRVVELVNVLSLFTRRTMLAWLPELTEALGITGDRFMVMFELDLQPDSSLKDLARSVMVSPSAMSVMINSMVEQGLATRIPDPADRRKVVLRLSDQGRTALRTLDEELAGRYQQYLDTLEADDRQEFAAAAQNMLQVVSRMLARSVPADEKLIRESEDLK
ncbi:MAG: MarR family transcriptional regulator [Spirochaetaceae bacterium]|nr:MAG: MarR family transcriptional regulator [Spirochaetaceae bacterium]